MEKQAKFIGQRFRQPINYVLYKLTRTSRSALSNMKVEAIAKSFESGEAWTASVLNDFKYDQSYRIIEKEIKKSELGKYKLFEELLSQHKDTDKFFPLESLIGVACLFKIFFKWIIYVRQIISACEIIVT